jgi:hypothetical protein
MRVGSTSPAALHPAAENISRTSHSRRVQATERSLRGAVERALARRRNSVIALT